MLYRMSGVKDGAHTLPQGGISNLIDALHKSALAAGVEIKTGVAVSKIVIDKDGHGQRASGVELQDGTVVNASRVVSSVDPKQTFLELVGARNLEIGFTNRINRLRSDGYVAKLHLALDGLPNFTGLDTCDGRMIIAPTMDSIEFAFDDAKYGNFSEAPVMEIILPSVHDSAMAPSGQHVLSAHVMYVPHTLKGGWTEQAKESLYQRLIDMLSTYAPGIEQQILHGELLTPDDLEKSYRLNGGHWHHTELSMDQMLMMRPTYEAAQYSTPIPGLFLCGAGSHPGGGLMGGPGHNAAKEILRSVK
jgi:phytoene dehydrogenase-like protein